VGVWAGRIAELLSRFSTERIRANFQLYRRRAAEQTIRKPGAWLWKAITDGYALPNSSRSDPNEQDDLDEQGGGEPERMGEPESRGGPENTSGLENTRGAESTSGPENGRSAAASGSLPPLEHKEIVSEAKKDRYVSQGVSEERFHRCPASKASRQASRGISRVDGPAERRFMYFDPEVGGPERRV